MHRLETKKSLNVYIDVRHCFLTRSQLHTPGRRFEMSGLGVLDRLFWQILALVYSDVKRARISRRW